MPNYHARLSPSSAHRWRACPGAPRLEAQFPNDSGSSPESREGTAAHNLAEGLLRGDVAPGLEQKCVIVEGYEIEITEEMQRGVRLFADTCLGLAAGDPYHAEMWLGFDALTARIGGIEGFEGGTVDFLCYHPADNSLDVADLKYGKGVIVEVQDNDQLLLYALAATLKVIEVTGQPPATIRTTIVQPRAEHEDGQVRTATYTWEELTLFSKEIIAAAQETLLPDAPLVPGPKTCRWCKAKAVCPALAGQTVALVQQEFGVIAAAPAGTTLFPRVEDLTTEQQTAIIAASSLIRSFLDAVSDHVRDQLMQGGAVPGYKLVEGRRSRDWKNPEAAEKYLRRVLGAKAAFAPKKLLSPAQAEKAVEAKGGQDPKALEVLIATNSGNPVVASEDNPKPALNLAIEAANQFEVLEANPLSGDKNVSQA